MTKLFFALGHTSDKLPHRSSAVTHLSIVSAFQKKLHMQCVLFEQKNHYEDIRICLKSTQKYRQDSLRLLQQKQIEEEERFPLAMNQIILHPRLCPISI